MASARNLTTTQFSALGELKRRGYLAPSLRAFNDEGRQYSHRTLNALVKAGFARWNYHREGRPYIEEVSND
jgi:hypothetical protein